MSRRYCLVFSKDYYIVWSAFENGAKLFQRVHGDGLVAPQVGDRVCANAVLVDHGVGRRFSTV